MPQKPIRVLIADDYHFYRYGLRVFLEEQEDISVVGEAARMDETIVAFEKFQPDVLLLDLGLPPAGGLAILRKIDGGSNRAIMLAGIDDESYLVDAIECGIAGYVLKNTKPEVILSAVREVGRGGKWLQRELTGKMFEAVGLLLGNRSDAPSRLLTPREIEVLLLLAQGHRNAVIADKLFISVRTVKVHITNLFRKLGLSDRVQATRYAIRHRLVRA